MSAPIVTRQVSRQISRQPGRRLIQVLVAALLLLAGAACQSTTSATGGPAAVATPVASAPPAATGGGAVTVPKPAQPKPGQAKPADPRPADTKPAGAGPPTMKGSGAADPERERIAERATWAPGQLDAHFEKHGQEGPYRSEVEYDRAARETIRTGTHFTYQDRESNAQRQGFYDKAGNRFTGVTRDGARITTHFRPNRGEAYVRGLEDSTYR